MRVRRMVASSICLFVCLVANNVDKGELCSPKLSSLTASSCQYAHSYSSTLSCPKRVSCTPSPQTTLLYASLVFSCRCFSRSPRTFVMLQWSFCSSQISRLSLQVFVRIHFKSFETSGYHKIRERESKSKPRFSLDISLTSFILSQPSVLNIICSRADNVQAEDHASQICCSRKTRGNCKTG